MNIQRLTNEELDAAIVHADMNGLDTLDALLAERSSRVGEARIVHIIRDYAYDRAWDTLEAGKLGYIITQTDFDNVGVLIGRKMLPHEAATLRKEMREACNEILAP